MISLITSSTTDPSYIYGMKANSAPAVCTHTSRCHRYTDKAKGSCYNDLVHKTLELVYITDENLYHFCGEIFYLGQLTPYNIKCMLYV